jgi:Ni,Fe-hydrogenase I small subunit
MKGIFFVLSFIIGQFAFAQTGVEFKVTSHQFGKVKKGVPVSFVFEYKNVSAKPIVIEFANADCGCTSPEFVQSAVPKGQKSTIKVTYNAAVEGVFKKSVNVKFTNSNQPYILTLEGEVAAEPKGSKAKS